MRSQFPCLVILLICFSGLFAGESCLFCHTDSAYTAVYDSSGHGKAGIGCADCHIKAAGFFEFLSEKYLRLLTFSSKNAHPAERPGTVNCLSCHQAVNHFNIVADDALPEQLKTIGMVIGHDKHFALRDSCMTCHKTGAFPDNKVLATLSQDDPMGCISCHLNVVHEHPKKYGHPMPKEKDCALCHKQPANCPSLKEVSDIKDDNRCTECHPNQYTF